MLFAFHGSLSAQTDSLAVAAADSSAAFVEKGDSLHGRYDFEAAIDAYGKALEILEDTLSAGYDSLKVIQVSDKLLLSENGRSMSSFAYSPNVVNKHKFSIEDFFLYYPLPDHSWRSLPNQLDSSRVHPYSKALYAPDDAEYIYFSSEDNDGIRNIYMTECKDTVWTYPTLLNEQLTSPEDEIYPMLSDDGRTMYFASKGLYGVGGYDIYMSQWSAEDNDWQTPVNMGFPYSSPADDFLFVNTEDGQYTIFASNRDCSRDSVWVYVLEFDNMPVRQAVEEPHELMELMRLEPRQVLTESEVTADIPENVDTRRYMNKMSEVRALRDSLSFYSHSLERKRNEYSASDDEQLKSRLSNEILRDESRVPVIQDSLDKAVAKLQEIEMEFLFNGVVIDPEAIMEEADHEVAGDATSYAFTKMNIGKSLDIRLMEPEKKFDYSFMVLEEGQFAEDNTIPQGVVYQVQIFSSTRKCGVASLKGLSPVFEIPTSSGKYAYRVGLFNTYQDVVSKLNTIKRVGFRNAYVVGYINGKEVQVSKARAEEKRLLQEQKHYRVEIECEEGGLDAEMLNGIRQQASGKDVARVDGDTVLYVIGPYTDKGQADALAEFVKAMGAGEAKVIAL